MRAWNLAVGALLAGSLMGCGLFSKNESKSFDKSQLTDREAAPSVDKENIRSTISESLGEYRKCYDVVLKLNPTANGKIEQEFYINSSGEVEQVKTVKNTLNITSMAECMEKVTATLKFEPPPENQVAFVRYPFVFTTIEKGRGLMFQEGRPGDDPAEIKTESGGKEAGK